MRSALVGVAALVVAVASAYASNPGRNGVIAFVSQRGPTQQSLFTVRPDGSSLRRLTGPPVLTADDAAFSRNGKLMAFSHGGNLWLARANGSRPRLLVRTGRDGNDGPLSPSFSPDGTTIAYAAGDIRLVGVDGKDRTRLVALPGDQLSPTWSPDGRRIAFSTAHRSIFVIDRRTRSVRRVASGWDPAWAPRGGLIAFSRSTGVHVMSADGRAIRRISPELETKISPYSEPAWANDGRRLVALGCCAEVGNELAMVIATMDPDGGDVRESRAPFDSALAPAWTAGGRIVFSDRQTLWSVDGRGGKARRFAAGVGDVRSPAWSPDGRRLAYVGEQGLVIAPAGGGKLLVLDKDSFGPSWAPDGERLAVSTSTSIDILTLATGERESVLADEGAGDSSKILPAWSPNGETIAYLDGDGEGSGRLGLYDVAARRPRLTQIATYDRPDWRPDGGALAYVVIRKCGTSWCYDVRVYDLRSGKTRPLIRNAREPAWSPDGRWIAFVRPARGNRELYVARSDGRGARRLTHNAGADAEPTWQPLPR